MGGRGSSYSFLKQLNQINRSNEKDFTLAEALGVRGNSLDAGNAIKYANPFYFPDILMDYVDNSNRVAVAYEIRRRGYDVTAQPTHDGDVLLSGNRLRGAFKGMKSIDVGSADSISVVANIENRMSGFGEGSRAIVRVEAKGQSHFLNVEFSSGGVRFVDSEVGKIHDKSSVRDFFKTVDSKKVKLTRVDHLDIADGAKKMVIQREKDIPIVRMRRKK